MKKLRITKITVKTREVVLVSKTTTSETANSHCPVCSAPLKSDEKFIQPKPNKGELKK